MPSQGPDPALTPRRTPRNIVPIKRGGETVVAQPNSKKSKTKSTALNVPTETQDFETEPPAETLPPAKKTRKSRKKVVDTPQENATVFEAASTSPPAPAPASALAPPTVVIIPTTPQAGEKAASGQADGATKKGTRKKNNSDIAQKVLEQTVEKQREKDAKTQRQIAKGKKKVVEETPAATQAFVEHARLNNDGGDAVTPNVLVRETQRPAKNKKKQKDSELLIAERIAQRFISPTPSIPHSTTTSGTEGSSHSSRIAYADSRATSLQPSRAGSPAPSFVQDDDNEPLDLDMMEILKDIPSELAPRITPPPALPAPFRDIRRRVPLPDPDSNMSTRERTEYKKKAKLTHRKIDDHDQTIASTALSRFESLVSTCNPFPTEEQTRWLAGHANVWACKKVGIANLRLIPGSPYEEYIFSRLSNSRSAQVTASNAETPLQYGFKGSSPETISFNQELATNLLHLGNFTLIGQSFEQLATYYENPVFQRILRRSAFLSDQSCGPVHRDLWQCITIPCLAGVATNVERVLMEYQSGDNTSIKFSARNFRTKYLSHIISLADLYKVNGPGLRALLSRMAKELLSPFASLSLTVHSVQPRIPLSILAARYQQAQAIKATPVAAVAGPSTRPRPKARQVEATPPSQPSTDDEIEDPGAWRAALDEGRPKEVFEQLIDSLGGSSDDEIGMADMTIVPQAGSGSTSADPSTTTLFQATRGAAGDDGSESDSGISKGEESDGEGKSGAGRVTAVAGVEQSEESTSEDEDEEEG